MTVKKAYRSPLRAAQAQATRRAIVAAAAELFVQHGYGPTSVDAIAERAGVSRKTVFTSVGGKAQTLKLALDWATAGDDEPVPVLERPHVQAALQEPDARRILTDFAGDVLEVMSRTAGVVAVLHGAVGLDADLRALHEDLLAQRLLGMRFLAGLLEQRGALRPELTISDAAHLLCVFNDVGVYVRLVIEQSWEPDRYRRWLAETLVAQLLTPSYRPKLRV